MESIKAKLVLNSTSSVQSINKIKIKSILEFTNKKYCLILIKKRLELDTNFFSSLITKELLISLKIVFISYHMNFSNIKKKILINIFFNYLNSNYKANRHLLGLPVHGQRTWSNNKSCKKNNVNLKLYLNSNLQKN